MGKLWCKLRRHTDKPYFKINQELSDEIIGVAVYLHPHSTKPCRYYGYQRMGSYCVTCKKIVTLYPMDFEVERDLSRKGLL